MLSKSTTGVKWQKRLARVEGCGNYQARKDGAWSGGPELGNGE